MRHQHIQFGTGTFDPVGGFDLGRAFGEMQSSTYAQAQASLYQNSHGFRGGTRFLGGVQLGRRIAGTVMLSVIVSPTFGGLV
jgi:hypothetical protein